MRPLEDESRFRAIGNGSRAYLGFGSNLGDAQAHVSAAIGLLAATPGVTLVARSGDYRTPPWGDANQDWFVNACAAVDTTLDPHALLEACLAVEQRLGRVRTRKWGPRTIDVDVLDYAGQDVSDDTLTLPHPYLLERAFVLVPLAEIAPDLVIRRTAVRDALAELDTSGITRLAGVSQDEAQA